MSELTPASHAPGGRVAARMWGILSGLLGGGRRCSRSIPPPGKPAGIPASAVSSEMIAKAGIVSGGCRLAAPKTPPKGPATERPFARLIGPALGVPQEVIAWAMAAKRKLIAYSEATGEYVIPELAHLAAIISGAYLDQGLTVTGKQRQAPGPS